MSPTTYLPPPCLHTLFDQQAAAFPDRVAVSAGGCRLTYRELHDRAGRAAAALRRVGVRRGTLVGLCADRSIDLVVGVLAVLKAGGAYVPLDPSYPAEHIDFLLSDSGVPVVAAVSRVKEALATIDVPICWFDQDSEPDGAPVPDAAEDVAPDDPAYVIYTSGSTGTPKGVLVEHRQVVALFEQTRDVLEIDDLDVWTLFHSASFDFSVWELWGALLHGGRLVVVGQDVARTPALFADLVRAERVTVLSQTPSAFRQFVQAERGDTDAASLRLVVLGGERLDVGILRRWFDRHGDRSPEVINMYGITEVTVHATLRRVAATDLAAPHISPIGAGLAATRVEVWDEAGDPTPDGTPGEIVVSGPGVVRGYLGKTELTAQRFVERGGRRWYRSGDRGVRDRGDLHYLGRMDRQLKIRGFRIEPAEVEARLLSHSGVATAVVLDEDHGDGDVRLVAYIVPAGGQGDPISATAVTAQLPVAMFGLPAHLRPTTYYVIGKIPLTPQGKADHDALRQLRPIADVEAATTPSAVAAIVEGVLRRTGLGSHDDLFDAGMTSLALVRIITTVNERFGLALTGAELDEATVAGLARCVEAATRPRNLQRIGG